MESAMPTRSISIMASPFCTLMDETVTIQLTGLLPYHAVTLRSYFDDERKKFESYAQYTSDMNGTVNTTIQPSEGGIYTGIEPMGLFWSMEACPGMKAGTRYMKADVTKPLIVQITAHNGHLDRKEVREAGIPIAATTVERWYLNNNVDIIKVTAGRVRGSLLKPKGPGPFPGVIDLFGGVRPGCNEIRAALLATKGYAALALAYYGAEGQPRLLEDVEVLEMEYFEEAINWLASQSFVQPGGIATIGICKGGEMTLAMAIHFPEKVRATVAISTAGSFSVCPTSYKGVTFPCADIDRYKLRSSYISFAPNGAAILKDVYETGPEDYKYFQKFEDIRCPTLIMCGEEDGVVPKSNSLMIVNKIQTRNSQCELIVYPGAGHLIEPPHAPICTWCQQPPWGFIQWGGIPAKHAHAQEEAWAKLLHFLQHNMMVVHDTCQSKL